MKKTKASMFKAKRTNTLKYIALVVAVSACAVIVLLILFWSFVLDY